MQALQSDNLGGLGNRGNDWLMTTDELTMTSLRNNAQSESDTHHIQIGRRRILRRRKVVDRRARRRNVLVSILKFEIDYETDVQANRGHIVVKR